ncbi:MAG: cell envelope integrity protein TolA [Acidobacteriaceae bacterium]
MPITEVPTNEAPPEPPKFGSRGQRYGDLESADLLHVIDDLEQANSWGRVREMIWISIIIHLLVLWYIVYGQKYIHLPVVHVITPAQQLEQHPKQLTYLQLPKDLLNQPKPKNTNRISDQNRVAEAPHPVQKHLTAAQIEAMRRAGRLIHSAPAPHNRPAPTQRPTPQMRRGQQAQKAQPHPEQAAPRPPAPPAQPLPSSNLSKLMAPPVPHKVQNFRNSPTTPGQQIQQALRAASQGGFNGGGAESGDDGMNAPVQHQGIQGSVNILSNTMGVDFAHYLQQVIAATKRAWYPIIPEEARPPLNKQGIVQIRFTINPDGSVKNMILYGPSGDVALDRAAWGGITGATPYPPLPKQFLKLGGNHLSLQFNFIYNETPGDSGN